MCDVAYENVNAGVVERVAKIPAEPALFAAPRFGRVRAKPPPAGPCW